MKRLLTIDLLAPLVLCIAAGGMLSWSIDRWPSIARAEISAASQTDRTTPIAPPPAHTIPPLQEFGEISIRPIFSSSRRPFTPATAPSVAPPSAPTPPQTPLSSMSLLGIVIGPDGRMAILKVAGSASATKVAERDKVSGWTVQQVLPDRILLQSGSTKGELTFPARAATAPTQSRFPVAPPRQVGARTTQGVQAGQFEK